MQTGGQRLRWAAVTVTAALILCLIGLLLVRGFVLGVYQVDILETEQLSPTLCQGLAVPIGLGVVWLIYRQSFIRASYTDGQHQALRLQAWILAACVLTASLLYTQVIFVPILSLLIGLSGLVAIRGRAVLAFRHPIIFKPLNTGPWAVMIGLGEIAIAAGLLYWFVTSLLGMQIF